MPKFDGSRVTRRALKNMLFLYAFSVLHEDGSGITNFVLGSGERHRLNDSFAGGRYCVVVSKPRAQVRDFPPKCINAANGQPGKLGGRLLPHLIHHRAPMGPHGS